MAGLLVLLFIVVPVLEIYVIVQVGQVIGAWPTVLLLIFESLLGAWLIRREGRRAWAALRDGVASGRLPDRELSDAGLVLVGGTLLLTPGFLTDIVGFFFVLPFTRPLARRLLLAFAARRFRRLVVSGSAASYGAPSPGSTPGPWSGEVIEGEVVDDTDGARPPS